MKYASQPAFTVLEVIIALALTVALMSMLTHWIADSHVRLQQNARHVTRLLSVASAYEVVRRDVQQASGDYGLWKRYEGAPVWHAQGADVCWHVHDGVLYRVSGTYDAKHATWREKSMSRVVSGIAQLMLMPEVDKKAIVHAVRITLIAEMGNGRQQFLAHEYLHNGVEL